MIFVIRESQAFMYDGARFAPNQIKAEAFDSVLIRKLNTGTDLDRHDRLLVRHSRHVDVGDSGRWEAGAYS